MKCKGCFMQSVTVLELHHHGHRAMARASIGLMSWAIVRAINLTDNVDVSS